MGNKRVPYCKECEHCYSTNVSYLEYYCKLKNNQCITVDCLPLRSPKWCPKRKANKL